MWHVWGRGEVYVELWWGEREGKRPLGRPKHRCEENVKMGL